MPGSAHQQRADVLSPHQGLDQMVLLYQHRQLCTVHHALSVEASRTLFHDFVISLVDYCNSTFGFMSAVHLRPLQCILNAAACLTIKRRKFDRITNSLPDELHWLPVHYRHTYKICLLVCKCLHVTTPSYLVEQCIPVTINLCSEQSTVCYQLQWCNLIGLRTWNQYPPNFTDPSLSFDNFCRLETLLFNRTYYSS